MSHRPSEDYNPQPLQWSWDRPAGASVVRPNQKFRTLNRQRGTMNQMTAICFELRPRYLTSKRRVRPRTALMNQHIRIPNQKSCVQNQISAICFRLPETCVELPTTCHTTSQITSHNPGGVRESSLPICERHQGLGCLHRAAHRRHQAYPAVRPRHRSDPRQPCPSRSHRRCTTEAD